MFLYDREQNQTLLYPWNYVASAGSCGHHICDFMLVIYLSHDEGLKSSDEVIIHHSDQGYVLFRLRYICFYFIPL